MVSVRTTLLKVKFLFVFIVSALNTPTVTQRYKFQPPNMARTRIRTLPSRSLISSPNDNLGGPGLAASMSMTMSKRFLSSETKESIGDISLASNSIIHDKYISQQFKWSNREKAVNDWKPSYWRPDASPGGGPVPNNYNPDNLPENFFNGRRN